MPLNSHVLSDGVVSVVGVCFRKSRQPSTPNFATALTVDAFRLQPLRFEVADTAQRRNLTTFFCFQFRLQTWVLPRMGLARANRSSNGPRLVPGDHVHFSGSSVACHLPTQQSPSRYTKSSAQPAASTCTWALVRLCSTRARFVCQPGLTS